MAGKSEYVVTGDKHLLDLGQVGDVKIVKPADFLRGAGEAGTEAVKSGPETIAP